MLKKITVEVFFRPGLKNTVQVDNAPNHHYYPGTQIDSCLATSKDDMTKQLHQRHPNAAYFHVLDVKTIDKESNNAQL